MPYQLLNIFSITTIYYNSYILFTLYMEREKDHVGILKALKMYAVKQILSLLMQCFLNVFDLSILSISHPTELVTP